MVGGATAFYLKFWVNRLPLDEITDFEPIFARSASAVTHSKNKFN